MQTNARNLEQRVGAEIYLGQLTGVLNNLPSKDPLDYLLSSSEDEDISDIKKVELKDGGSDPKCVTVLLQGVPATGLIDSGADITIMGGELFKTVAVAAKLKKKDLQKADKTPKTYDQRVFSLDGRVNRV